MFVINDSTGSDVLFPKGFGRGHDPAQVAPGVFRSAAPSEIPLVPESEWVPRIRDRKKYKAGLRDLFKSGAIGPVKDQNGQGYCWSYSVVRSVEYARAIQGQEYVALSAHSVACKIKNFRDEGGWCGLSQQYIAASGVVPESLWPAKSMSRSHDTATNWAAAKKYRITEDYVDLSSPVYDRNMTFAQAVSCLLNNVPVVFDLNWWGHSVLIVDLDVVDGEVCPDGDNSWTPGWGDNGTFRLQGSRRFPDGAVATRAVDPS